MLYPGCRNSRRSSILVLDRLFILVELCPKWFLGKDRRKKMSIIPSIAREKSKEKAAGKDKITAVTNAQMLNIKESLNQEVRIRNEEETISFWETKKPQGKTRVMIG